MTAGESQCYRVAVSYLDSERENTETQNYTHITTEGLQSTKCVHYELKVDSHSDSLICDMNHQMDSLCAYFQL